MHVLYRGGKFPEAKILHFSQFGPIYGSVFVKSLQAISENTKAKYQHTNHEISTVK